MVWGEVLRSPAMAHESCREALAPSLQAGLVLAADMAVLLVALGVFVTVPDPQLTPDGAAYSVVRGAKAR